jgi:nitroreductase
MTALDAISRRHAVRAFTTDAVDDHAIRALLEAAVRAPTAMHAEPWAFVVIQDRALLKKYSDLAKSAPRSGGDASRAVAAPHRLSDDHATAILAQPEFNIFYDAGTLVVICAKNSGSFATADCWLAAENLMLAAVDMGLGTCPIGFAVATLNRADVKAELGIPTDVTAVAPIIVGRPRGTPSPTSRKEPELICWRRG